MAALAAAQAPGPQQDTARAEQRSGPELGAIVQRMERAATENRERYRAYVITRAYRLYGSDDEKPNSEVTAEISFVPPNSKDFQITETKGSSRGETVVRRILESESKDAASGNAPGAVTGENYDFTLLGRELVDGHECYVLALKPKRKEKQLLVGRAWVDADTYRVRRVQGVMAKMPSWWLRSAEVRLDFGDVDGMWLQTHTKATAEVRIFGRHTLVEHALKIRTSSAVAGMNWRESKTQRIFLRPEAVVGVFGH